jgi:adenylate kinase
VKAKCDRCSGELYQRADDTEDTVQKRLKVYFEQTAPLIDYYQKKRKLLEIEGERGIDEVRGEMISALRAG